MSLLIAKQRAGRAKGMAFYVTKKGVKNETEVKKSGYEIEYKVVSNGKETRVWDGKGKEVTVSPKLRNTTNEKVGKSRKRKEPKQSTDSGSLAG